MTSPSHLPVIEIKGTEPERRVLGLSQSGGRLEGGSVGEVAVSFVQAECWPRSWTGPGACCLALRSSRASDEPGDLNGAHDLPTLPVEADATAVRRDLDVVAVGRSARSARRPGRAGRRDVAIPTSGSTGSFRRAVDARRFCCSPARVPILPPSVAPVHVRGGLSADR